MLAGGEIRLVPGRKRAARDDDRADQADTGHGEEQSLDADRRAIAPPAERADDRGQSGLAQRTSPAPCPQPGRCARAEDRHAADEDAREADSLERRDGDQHRRVADESRRTARRAKRLSRRPPAVRCRTEPAIRGKAYMNGTSMLAPNAQATPTSAGLPPSATTWIE